MPPAGARAASPPARPGGGPSVGLGAARAPRRWGAAAQERAPAQAHCGALPLCGSHGSNPFKAACRPRLARSHLHLSPSPPPIPHHSSSPPPPPGDQAYWPVHRERCRPNHFADALEPADPKFASWMRGHGRQAVLKDDEVGPGGPAVAAWRAGACVPRPAAPSPRLPPHPLGQLNTPRTTHAAPLSPSPCHHATRNTPPPTDDITQRHAYHPSRPPLHAPPAPGAAPGRPPRARVQAGRLLGPGARRGDGLNVGPRRPLPAA